MPENRHEKARPDVYESEKNWGEIGHPLTALHGKSFRSSNSKRS